MIKHYHVSASDGGTNMRVTVFTPTYNRANVLQRVYDSLCQQTYKDFCWLIIDDGSKDGTKNVVEKFQLAAGFPIEYHYQENRGKHTAFNKAVKLTKSELFVIADSDDSFVPESLEILVNTWDGIENKGLYKGVTCRCIDSVTGEPINPAVPEPYLDCNEIELSLKFHITGEKWSIMPTRVLREYPFPEPDEALHFFPETVIWQNMAKKYKARMINAGLRVYYRDQENAMTNKKNTRYKENMYLWEHYINEMDDYFFLAPKMFLKAYIGLSRDGILNQKSFKEILSIPNRGLKKVLVCILYPIGLYLAKRG